jgi:hypothetical protein
MTMSGSGLNIKDKFVDMSANVGMRGDFDKDAYALGVISDKANLDNAAKSLANPGEYDQYLFNHYALKEKVDMNKAASVASSLQEARIGQYGKAVETKIATGRVNESLTKMKLGLMYNAPEKYKGLAPVFAELEQAAISKHGVAGAALYEELASAYTKGDEGSMTKLFEGFLGGSEINVKGGFNGKNDLSYNLTAKEASKAVMDSRTNIDDIYAEHQAAKIASGKKQVQSVDQALELTNRLRSGSMDPAKTLMYQNQGRVAQTGEKANRLLRQAGTKATAFGKAFSKVKGPALIGAAAAAGIALMAPSVSGTLSPKSEGTSGGRTMSGNDLGYGGPGMSPPQPRVMSSPKTYDVGGLRSGSRANISMSLDNANSSGPFQKYSRQLSKGADVRIRTTDDRSVMDPQRLANKVQERL